MARDGKLTRYLDTQSLTILLTELFSPARKRSTKWVATVSERLGSMSSKIAAVREKGDRREE